ncbi:hypothetical protein BGZ76_002326 [Entomortierella beljakovae]|nr:hypothetical protein BGZ76_002326 [Entomortierella beljakovae]
MSSVQEQPSGGTWTRATTTTSTADDGAKSNLPPLLDHSTRILLSPVPASMAQAPLKATTSTLASLSPASSSSSSTTTVTLYPVESVPSHLLCAICTLPYENPVHFLPCCHVFCLECIQLWIGMNLGDDLLQNELRRAYPAEGDILVEDETANMNGYNEMSQMAYSSQTQPTQQQFMFELARMSGSRSRNGSSGNNYYETFSHLSPAQQQLLQQQQIQQRIAVLLESREMPKCPMCRTGLHINGWDRIEEHIKVPVSVSPRPANIPAASSNLEWQGRRTGGPGQRASSNDRHRTRTNRFPSAGVRGRNESNGTGEGNDEEIEMEQVGVSRNLGSNALSPYPPSSASTTYRSRQNSRSDIAPQRFLGQPTILTDQRMYQYTSGDGNDGDDDDDEIQSPATAVIGRRPSEWMRYQQRQLQAHQERQQANRLRANPNANMLVNNQYDQDDTPHPHNIAESRYNEQQEQIRRLYQEQENQEEQLRNLTARAASIIEEQEEIRRLEAASVFSTSTSANGDDGINSLQPLPATGAAENNHQRESSEFANVGNDGNVQRLQLRHSLLQIDTSLSRPSNQQSHSQQISREDSRSHDSDAPQSQIIPEEGTENPTELNIDNNLETVNTRHIHHESEAWAGCPPSPGEESDVSIPDSVSDSTRSSLDSQSPSCPLSPYGESTISFRTSSTYSQSVQNRASTRTSISQCQSSHSQWHGHSIALQMPTIETDSSAYEHETTPQHDRDEQIWESHHTEEGDKLFNKDSNQTERGEFSGSASRLDLADPKSESSDSNPVTARVLDSQGMNFNSEDIKIQGSSSSASLGSELFVSSSSNWKSGSSMVSPLLRDLDIQTPIVSTGSTVADMRIDEAILARARSNSVFSDEELSHIRGRPSPIDSPIPTPSTARPRRRFPAGISLNGEDEEEEEEEELEEEQVITEDSLTIGDSASAQSTPEENEDSRENIQATGVSSDEVQANRNEVVQENIPEADTPVVENNRQSLFIAISTTTRQDEPTTAIIDPLSVNNLENLIGRDSPLGLEQGGPALSPVSTPVVQPAGTTMASPPPLPLPLPVTEESEVDRSLSPEQAATDESNELGLNSEGHVQSSEFGNSDRHTGIEYSQDDTAALLDHFSTVVSTEPQESTTTTRVREHIQYRTIVRYQPRLPKAHVMSDLISQIRVQCPHTEFGCVEIMEMQKAIQHGREKCQFRMVMCPRSKCGLWMRADQIVEHVLMVEPGSVSSPLSSSSASSPSSSGPPSNSSVRNSGRTANSSQHQRNGSQSRTLRGLRALTNNGSSSTKKQQAQDSAKSLDAIVVGATSNSLIPSCAGLTWERGQKARATGIIGQLTEENTSLRHMIRQLRMQNSKLLKEKDKYQRYANLGLGRD